MMKLQLLYLTLWSVSDAAYISRMAVLNHNNGQNRIRPTAFRPGVMLRPWNTRLVQSASHRVPYVVYRNNPHRYSVKHYTPTRMFSSPWKATRLTSVPTSTEYEFVRAASSVNNAHAGGAIHTIPAPNLSLNEKPIVVIEGDVQGSTSEAPKIYEVTEKIPDQSSLQIPAKIEQPVGFSKSASLTTPELQSIVRNGAALQLASDLGLSAVALPQSFVPQQIPQTTQHNSQNFLQSIIPQQFSFQNFNNLPSPQEMIQAGPEGIVISPSALYQPDPAFLQKLQTQLLQRFPGLEFVPYAADIQQVPPQNIQVANFAMQSLNAHPFQAQNAQQFQGQNAQQFQAQNAQQFQAQSAQHFQAQNTQRFQTQSDQFQHQNAQQSVIHPVTVPPQNEQTPPIFLLQNEQYNNSFVGAESQNLKNVVQRETQEGIVTLVPQVAITNATSKEVEVKSASTPQNITLELIPAEPQPQSTTVKYVIETTTEEQRSTPVIIAQVENQGSASNLVPIGFTVQNVPPEHNRLQNAQNIGNSGPIPQNNGPVTENVGLNGPKSQNSNHNEPPYQNNGNSGSVSQSVANNGLSTQNNGNLIPQSITPSGFNVANPQLGQRIGNVVTDGFYSAINDVRVAAALAQAEKPQEQNNKHENVTTTVPTSTAFVQQPEPNTNKTSEIKHSLGVPFAKTQNSVNVAYTLHRTDDKDAKVAKDGSVYAGQIVEASVSEDTDFNLQNANLMTRRAPIRLVAVTGNKETTTTTSRSPSKVVVKARIPPKSKLTYDDKTGEPVLRIYASYVDNPTQKEAIVAKLSNMKRVKEVVGRKQDAIDNWKGGNIKSLAKPFEANANQVSQFGVKLKSRSDDYVPLFEEYEY